MNLDRAIKLAFHHHKDQKDKSGSPYILHLFRVMNRGKNENEKICGMLHDIVEDTQCTFEDLENEGFNDEIVDALKCVTKTSEQENYNDFIWRVKTNPLAVRVKINDLEDNLDVRRLSILTDRDVTRINKYLKAYKELIEYESLYSQTGRS